ncbi:MAG: pilus assembly FimT family protein [Akkermansiaceae bacterium]
MKSSINHKEINPRVVMLRGFTLLETLAVFILVGVLAGVMFQLTARMEVGLASEVEQLESHLRYTQARAQADIHPWRLVWMNDDTYQLGPVITPGAGFTPSPIPGADGMQGVLQSQVTADGPLLVQFDSWGRPTDEAGEILSVDQTVTLMQGSQTKTITIISETGQIP